MAHPAQKDFCLSIKGRFEGRFIHQTVLDVGSLDINGNNRDLFLNCDYVGCDIAPGKNVTMVSEAHKLEFEDGFFDTIISTECFEHDKYYAESLQNIVRMLGDCGGLFLFTCATTGRSEHGTINKSPKDSPLTASKIGWQEYYKNLTEKDIREAIDVDGIFREYEFRSEGVDLYFYGVKK